MRYKTKFKYIIGFLFLITVTAFLGFNKKTVKPHPSGIDLLRAGFLNPPASARPGVYWYFMDGNLSKEGMTKDLEAMKKAGIGYVLFLEVNVGVPRGPVDFFSDKWLNLFNHAVSECKRLGIAMTLGIGPGWTGSGGPWVKPAQSMQHLVASSIDVTGADNQKKIMLPVPLNKKPYFGEGQFTPELKKQRDDFYEDVAVLAFPSVEADKKIADIDEKALYYRAPYSSAPGVKAYLPSSAGYDEVNEKDVIHKNKVLDLTDKLSPDGTLNWIVPPGKWTVMRFGRRNNGALTRPAPIQGLGFESDKMDAVALNAHLDAYVGKILHRIGMPDNKSKGGLKMLHMDSWEMGSQNWTPQLRKEFIRRRGYDPLPYYPVYAGNIVESVEVSERFLWDLRQTCNELMLENHAEAVKKYSHQHNLGLSIEPYDMNPTADLELGAVADVPMCEFWSKGYGFNSSFSCIEATSIAHIMGKSLVPAEAFTAESTEGWKQYPGSMKNQGDWAFATGINRFVYHTFAHKPFNDDLKPGMNMGPYGVHWDRNQTWWPMVPEYHRYISRCQYILQQGKAVADIIYLTPEGAPHVFRPPSSAMTGNDTIPDRRGHNFDGCSPAQLYAATVKNRRIVFPGGASYPILVLPASPTMTPALLQKIKSLINAGATVVGAPPQKSPGLTGYPECDEQIKATVKEVWGGAEPPSPQTEHAYGNGKIVWGGKLTVTNKKDLYPEYDDVAALLNKAGVVNDFESTGSVRYTHRTSADWDIYFIANRTDKPLKADCKFRSTKGSPELWDPLTGKIRMMPRFSIDHQQTGISIKFEPYQSYFIVFAKNKKGIKTPGSNFHEETIIATLDKPWNVSFDPKWGGPAKTVFDHLTDWSKNSESGIKYYSGIAVYHQKFDMPVKSNDHRQLYLDLGEVKNIARVKLNGKDLGVLWTAPWRVDITNAIKPKDNYLEIQVANLWPNRLIGDESLPDDGIKNGKFPDWLLNGTKRTSGRYTFSTYRPYKKDSPLLKSGLIGPVTIQRAE